MGKLLRNVTLKQVLDRLKNEVLYGRTYLHVAKGLFDSDPVIRQIAPLFFGITTDAHLEQAMMVIARLYDETDGAVTLPRMLDLAASDVGSFQRGDRQQVNDAIAKAREAIENLRPVLESLKVRRDKWMAHLDPRPISNPSAFAEQAKLTIPELEEAFKVTEEVPVKMACLYEGTVGDLIFLSHDDYQSALDLLRRAKCAEIEEFEKRYGSGSWTWQRPKDCTKQPYDLF